MYDVLMVEEFTSYENLPTLSYKRVENPLVFIGTCIKSQYDEHRILIKDSLNAKRISHCDRFFYGVTLELMSEHLLMIEKLKNVQYIDLYTYNKIISENDLSCNDNFIYLEDGVYPVDEKHICKYIKNFEYDLFFDDDPEMPIHQKIKSVNMFILVP
jgi:hypothetical protein